MNRELLRVGLIGVGGVGKLHFEAYRKAQGVRVVAVCDTSAQRLESLSSSAKTALYGDAAKMLECEKLDIACVLTPPSSHERLTELCTRHGVHVFCEKPLALSLDAADRMMGYAKSAGVELFYGSSYRFLPAIVAARALIIAGNIGEVRLLREQSLGARGLDEIQLMHDSHYPFGGPGGFAMGLADHGIHLIDIFSWLMESRVRASTGRGNISGQPAGPEFLHMAFENHAIGQLVYDEGTFPTELPNEGLFSGGDGWEVDGFVIAGNWSKYPGCIHVYGSTASLRIFHYANRLVRIDKTGIREIQVRGRPSPFHFATQIDQFADDIQTGRSASTPGSVGYEVLRVMLSAYENGFSQT